MADVKNNYYGMLGLSAENYEGDPKKLSEIAEKSIKEWKSHKKREVQNRANIHGLKIREAITEPVKWKSIYDEYKTAMVSDHKISRNDIQKISYKNKVSEGFIEGICKKRGYSVENSQNTKAKADFTLDNLKPKSFLQIQEAQKTINELGADNLIDLLSTAEISGVCIVISESTSKDRVLEALEELHKKWMPIPQNGSKGIQKEYMDRICAGFTKFLKDNQFSEYIQYLKYIGAKHFLEMIIGLDIKELSREAVNFAVNRLTEFTEDFDKADSVLENFCVSRGINRQK